MQYLMIENEGVAPIESYIKLGFSTARGTDKIGQFGTGNKHAILVCLRAGLDPLIYSGTDKIRFQTKSKMVNNAIYDEVQYCLNQLSPKDLNWSTDFGAIDWEDNIEMALREFVSNGLDQTDDINVELVDKPRAKSGFTRVFIPLDNGREGQIKEYLRNIKTKFLQFDENWNDEKFLPGNNESSPKLYRRGVFVCNLYGGQGCLFNYNLDFSIDECRNLDSWRASKIIGKAISNDKIAFLTFINAFFTDVKCWETDKLGEHYLDDNKQIGVWWKEKYGDTLISSNSTVHEHATRKGVKCLMAKGLFRWLQSCGVPTIDKELNEAEKEGYNIFEPTTTLVNQFNELWDMLKFLGMTDNKVKPTIKMFTKQIDGGKELKGLYDPNTKSVLINQESVGDYHVLIHEIGHHVTGSRDGSADMQEWGFRVAVAALTK